MKNPPVEFIEKAARIAGSEFSASITGGGFDWIRTIFEQYTIEGSMRDVDAWLRVRFAGEFR